MIELHNARYLMDMGFGHDVWRLHGNVVNHPNFKYWSVCWPSSPVKFDEENKILTTASGREYKICSFATNEQKVIEQIKADIANQGYEIH